jgi:hypothetical protein
LAVAKRPSRERSAGVTICHCKSAEEVRALWNAIAGRLAACKLVLHPEKTKIVYCKDVNRRATFPTSTLIFSAPVSSPKGNVGEGE